MKKLLMFAFFPWLFIAFGYKAMAQDGMDKERKDKKEAEEIVIRKKGGKDATIKVEIKGDEVFINGKPLSEYKDDDVTVNKRKTIVRNGGRGGNAFILQDDGNSDITLDPPVMDWGENTGGAFLGVSTDKVDDGAKITEPVSKESAACKAGLQKGDIITKIDDTKIDGPGSLFEAINAKKPKDEVKVTYKRDGKEKTTKAILGERKTSFSKSYSYSAPDGSYKTYTMPYVFSDDNIKNFDQLQELQGQLGDLNNNYSFNFPRRQKLGLKIQDTEEGNGVKVLEVQDSSAAATAGLKKDDIITEIGGEKVTNTDEAREQLQENNEKGTYPIKAKRNGSEMTFTIKIPKKLKTTNL
ncbi:MAG: PDZ domain-containing protein [Ferruginibacter sp.]